MTPVRSPVAHFYPLMLHLPCIVREFAPSFTAGSAPHRVVARARADTTMIIDQASYDYWSTHSNTCVAPCADVAGLSESSASSCITEGPAELPHQIAAAPQNYCASTVMLRLAGCCCGLLLHGNRRLTAESLHRNGHRDSASLFTPVDAVGCLHCADLIVTCDNLSSGCGTASKPVRASKRAFACDCSLINWYLGALGQVYFYFQYSACVPDCSVGCQPDGCGHTCPPV